MGFRNLEETKREKGGIVYFVRKNMVTAGSEFERFAIQTHFVKQGESYLELINKYVVPFYEKVMCFLLARRLFQCAKIIP